MSRAPREAPPPGKFLRSCSGQVAQVIDTRKRNDRQEKLYRLWYGDVTGSHLWTKDDLLDHAVRWYQRKPKDLRARP